MTAFIEFAEEIINTSLIETIWKRDINVEGQEIFEILIGKFDSRNLMDDPTEYVVLESYLNLKKRDERFEDLKHQLRVPI